MFRLASAFGTLAVLAQAHAGEIYASGQFFDGSTRVNYIYRIDPVTGAATPASPPLASAPAAIAGTPDGRLLAYVSSTLNVFDLATGGLTPLGASTGLSATGLDVFVPENAAFIVTTSSPQLYRLSLTDGSATAVSSPGQIKTDLDAFYGTSTSPFVISLGSTATNLYGINSESGRTNLIRFDTATGSVSVVGAANAAGSVNPQLGGFSALTGADLDGDGSPESILGNINFDNTQSSPANRFGGIVRYNLADGTWTLLGNNPGIIFFGLAFVPDRCEADFNADGFVDFFDFDDFVSCFESSACPPGTSADFDRDGFVDFFDLDAFVTAFEAGC